jgi:hypothetical protein
VRARARPLHPHSQREPLAEVRNIASVAQPRGWKFGLGFPHPAERPLDPWTLFLDEGLNVSQREVARDDHLHAVRIHLVSRMQSAIRASDPVRRGCHRDEARSPIGRRTFVHIPQIGEGATDNHMAASFFPLRRRSNFCRTTETRQQIEKERGDEELKRFAGP